MSDLFSKLRLKRFRNWVLAMLGAVAVILLGLAWLGFPAPVTRWILAGVNKGDYYVAARDLKLNLYGGLDASDVTVYRKGLTGPPCFKTRRIRVLYRLFDSPAAGHSRIKSVHARDGVVQPGWGVVNVGTGAAPREFVLPRMSMEIALADFDVFGVWVEQARVGVETDPAAVRLSGINGRVGRELQGGTVTGTVAWERGRSVTGRVVTSVDPHALIPALRLLHPPAIPLVERFTFPVSPPRLDFSFEAKVGDPVEVNVKGVMRAAQYAYRGAAIGFGNISWDYVYGRDRHGFKLDPFLLVVSGRHAQGRLEFDLKGETAVFEATSAIDMETVLRLAGIREQRMGQWQFEGGTQVAAKGSFDYRHPERSRYGAGIEGGRVSFGPLRVNAYSARFDHEGNTNRFSDISGKIGGGTVVGSAMVVSGSGESDGQLAIRAELIHASADDVFRVLAANTAFRTGGKLYGNVELTRPLGVIGAKFDGQGQMAVREAKLLSLPQLSGLAAELSRLGPDRAWREAVLETRLSFRVAAGAVESRDIKITGEGIEMTAQVQCTAEGALTGAGHVKWAKPQDTLGQTIRAMLAPGVEARITLGGTIASPKWTVENKSE